MISLYIHIPFCLSKCGYCDFNSFEINDLKIYESYVNSLCMEIQKYGKNSYFQKKTVETIFFGGGTPSILKASQLNQILQKIYSCFTVSNFCEISVEANPETLTFDKVCSLKSGGFNRFSLGVQSFNDSLLKKIKRTHNSESSKLAIGWIRRAGVKNFSIDLIFGLPGQTLNDWEHTLKDSLSFAPFHISTYNLTLEKGTKMYENNKKKKFALPGEELYISMYEKSIELCSDFGYEHYEISNFSLPHLKCKHNLRYWRHQEYLGVGAGAVSFVKGKRWKNLMVPKDYMLSMEGGSELLEDIEELSERQLMNEEVMLALRTMEGVNLIDFNQKYSIDFFKIYEENITNQIENNFLKIEKDYLKVTHTGLLLYNEVVCSFF